MIEKNEQDKSTLERLLAVRDLVLFEKPLDEVVEKLKEFEWDYCGNPFVLMREHLERSMRRYLAGEISSGELENWADAIEMREDISFEEKHRSWIEGVMNDLANPTLNGPIAKEDIVRKLEL